MKKGTKVSWQVVVGTYAPRSSGVTISDEEDGKVLIAADTIEGAALPYEHIVRCPVELLRVEKPEVEAEPAPAAPEA